MANYTYIASDNTATNGTALGVDNADIVVYKILTGTGTDGATYTLYNIVNPLNGSTANIAYKLTQPTAAAGKDWVREVDFGPEGMVLGEGGNIVTTGTATTVVWDYSK